MKSLYLTALMILPVTLIYSQTDPAATAILDRFSGAALSAPSVSIDFRLTTFDAAENRSDTISGNLVLSGDKYRLTMPESVIYFDGTDSWNHMPSVNEVTISKPGDDDISFFSKPSLLFTMYRQDYKARLLDETAVHYIIDLYPEEMGSDLVRIRVTIGKSRSELIMAEYVLKNGITVTLRAMKYDLKFTPPARYFQFDPSRYKDIEIIDMRF